MKLFDIERINLSWILAILAVAVAAPLRLINLGYSDFQGDEIKALFLQVPDVFRFLMEQRKGPVQFVVTALVKVFDPAYSNHYFDRLPFALAGILSVFFFYKFVELHWNKKLAFYASFFLATNGFIVAFNRIIQYQSFVILFMCAALYFFSLAVAGQKIKVWALYMGMFMWAFSVLSHYDGVFIAPFVFYLLFIFFKHPGLQIRRKATHFLISGALAAILLAAFYVPFVMSLDTSTTDYWMGRINGDSIKISSSTYLFTVYQPIYVFHIYYILFVLGIFYFLKLAKPDFSKTAFRSLKRKVIEIFSEGSNVWLVVWFLLSFLTMEVLINIPGTHIFTYIIPAIIIMANGIEIIENIGKRLITPELGTVVAKLCVAVVFVFIFMQSYTIFVDNSSEYPWEYEKFYSWTLAKPSANYHLSLFGFPYYRNWDSISEFIKEDAQSDYYGTNERDSIVRYYVPLKKNTDSAGYYIFISNPQTFADKFRGEKLVYWASKNDPYKIFYDRNREIARVYLMPAGTEAELKLRGY